MTITLEAVPLTGCRHDVLGHALKAIGILRAISTCAAPEDCDPDAEGWWSPDDAAFMIRSDHYPDAASLVKFFAEKYRPTPIIAAWNKSGGVTDKIEVTISCRSGDVNQFRADNEATLEASGLKKTKKLNKAGDLVFALSDAAHLEDLKKKAASVGLTCLTKEKQSRGKVTTEVTIASMIEPLERFRTGQSEALAELGFSAIKKLSKDGQMKFSTDSPNRSNVEKLIADFNVSLSNDGNGTGSDGDTKSPGSNGPLHAEIIAKESGKKDGVLPNAAKLLSDDQEFQRCLELARQYVAGLQGTGDEDESADDVFLRYRDQLPDAVAESFDALCALHISQQNDNPLFVRRGRPGDKVNADIFLNFWDYFTTFRKNPSLLAEAALFGGRIVGSGIAAGDRKGKGTPFFPDAIKSYNQGADWVTEDFPFCPLDYLLAVEGALAMRGATSKTLSARSRSRAAFPFVFEGTETMTDEQGKALRVATSFWLPVWIQPTTFDELQSYLLDGQARLPGRDCRFSSDFARAIRSQGVDAGFFAFQEFQFKLKGANVPWTAAGRFVPCSRSTSAGVLNELLAPVDASGFLDQFEFNRERKSDLHPLRAPVLEAIETAAAEPSADKIVDVLSLLASLNTQLARSKALREKVSGGRGTFVPPLRCDDWSAALQDLDDDPEFEIARALASVRGHEKLPDGTYSEVEPFLGSLVPLKRKQSGWYLPDPPSPQAVWTGIGLSRDLSSVLARRVLDSAKDVRPAVVGTCSARLTTILRFLHGELDDRRIARLVEALSLIDWRFSASRGDDNGSNATDEEGGEPVPVTYAAVRSLIEVACEKRRPEPGEKDDLSGPRAKVQRTVALLSRQEPRLAASATADALRRLAIVGVPNPYGEECRREKPKLAGRDVVQVGESPVIDVDSARRLAAAVLIPLEWRDRWSLFRSITLPQNNR
ncbi:type I-U CRISPR-associated protein Csx17 [bacterium]|nr:type I-U CRISPR-associated protein Csx17 [bacterium]